MRNVTLGGVWRMTWPALVRGFFSAKRRRLLNRKDLTTSVFTTKTSVADILDRFPVLKEDASLIFFRVEPYLPTETICLGRSPTESPFFYMFSCLFSDLHVSLPFDNFTMGVFKALNVAPTQLHPNTWTSIQAFRQICDVLRLHPTPSCFLSYYTSTWSSLFCAIHWLVGWVISSSTPKPLCIKSLKKDFSKSSSDRKPCHIYLTKPVDWGFLCLGLGSLRSLRSSLVRPWMLKS